MLPRLIAAAGALTAAVLVFFPLPFSDLLVMAPVQLAIVLGILLVTRQPLNPLRLGLGVLAYAFVGVVVTTFVGNVIPFLGKFFAAPFALVWCYGLGELAISRAQKA